MWPGREELPIIFGICVILYRLYDLKCYSAYSSPGCQGKRSHSSLIYLICLTPKAPASSPVLCIFQKNLYPVHSCVFVTALSFLRISPFHLSFSTYLTSSLPESLSHQQQHYYPGIHQKCKLSDPAPD